MQKRSYLITAIVIAVIFLFVLFGGNKVKKEEPAIPTTETSTNVSTSSISTSSAAGSDTSTPPASYKFIQAAPD